MPELISVIISTYNRRDLISRAIRSVLEQEFKSWELFVVDDGSTDNTDEVVKKFLNDNRIKFIRINSNQGVNYARNRGIKEARGKWISFLDSDDEYEKNGLLQISKCLDKIPVDIEVLGFNLVDKENKRILGYKANRAWDFEYPTYEQIVTKDNVSGNIHYCVSRSVFGKFMFNEKINGFESEFYSKIAKVGIRFEYFNITPVIVHNDAGVRLNKQQGKDQSFIDPYENFVNEHYQALLLNKPRLRNYEFIISKLKQDQGHYWESLVWKLRGIRHLF